MTLFIVLFFVTGILGGMIYFSLNLLETQIQQVDFDIPFAKNTTAIDVHNVTTFQDVMDITVYKMFDVVSYIPYLVYFMLFSYIIGLALVAYLSSKNPIFFVVHFLYTLVLTYFAVILANSYIKLLTMPFINSMMTDFPVYNKLMLNLPQVFFITSLVFAGISFINIIKPSTAEHPYGLNYSEEY